MTYLTHDKILEISKNAKIDRLELLYIDLTLVLKRIDKESINPNTEPYQFCYHLGLKQGYLECLEVIERNIKVLSESKA